MSILSVDKIQPIGSGSTVTVNATDTILTNVQAGVVTATSFSGSGANLTNLPAQATIANNADNRVITGGSGVNLNGEANLTFSSSLVVTDGNGTVTTGGNYINLKRTTANTNYINAPLANADLVISADENLLFHTVHTGDFNSTERLRINAAGDILLGTDQATIGCNTADGSDNRSFSLCGGSDASQSRGAIITIYGNEGNDGHSRYGSLYLRSGNTTTGIVSLWTQSNERLRIDSSGRLLLGTTTEGHSNADDLTIATTGNTGITVRSGTGSNGNIFFSDATSGDAEFEGMIYYAHGTNSMRFATAQTERLVIDSNGNVLPSADNTQNLGSSSKRWAEGHINWVKLGTNGSWVKENNVRFQSSGDAYIDHATTGQDITFRTSNSSSLDTTSMFIRPDGRVQVYCLNNSRGLELNVGSNAGALVFDRNGHITSYVRASDGNSNVAGSSGGGSRLYLNKKKIQFYTFTHTTNVGDAPTFVQRMEIGENSVRVGKQSVLSGDFDTIRIHNNSNNVGTVFRNSGGGGISQHNEYCWLYNRMGSDGMIVAFNAQGSQEGSINVSGSSVSYNGGVLTRWSQLVGISTNVKSDRPTIYQGTVMSNLDEMCEWTGEENMQLNKTQVSTASGDKNVAGVFWAWDDDDDNYTNDFFVAQTGDYIIRVAGSTTVARGDLLESAGDGTAKPQSDDIIRSKTVAKVTSGIAHTTYPDGTKTYPCVLMGS